MCDVRCPPRSLPTRVRGHADGLGSRPSIDIPLSDISICVLEAAEEEAKSLLHKHVGAEYLLLGLLRIRDSVAFEVLHELGMELLSVKTDILLLQKELTPSKKKVEE